MENLTFLWLVFETFQLNFILPATLSQVCMKGLQSPVAGVPLSSTALAMHLQLLYTSRLEEDPGSSF